MMHLRDVTKEELSHLPTGRPFYKEGFDVSVSHKHGLREARAVASPYRIVIDIEDLEQDIHTELFMQYIVSERERDAFHAFCSEHSFSRREGVIAFWSMKESFFKAMDHHLFMNKLYILHADTERIVFDFGEDIREQLLAKKLELAGASFSRKGRYFFSQVLFKGAES